MGNARPIDFRPQSEVQVGTDKLEVVASFCYLGDMLSAGGDCEISVTIRVKTAWKKFRELLPVLKSRHLSYKTHGHVYSSCMRTQGGTLIFSYIHRLMPFLGVQNFEFQYFLGFFFFRKMNIFGRMKILRIFFLGHHKM